MTQKSPEAINGANVTLVRSFLTFCENQSGGRPGSEKGLMALLTDTLEDKDKQLRMNTRANKRV